MFTVLQWKGSLQHRCAKAGGNLKLQDLLGRLLSLTFTWKAVGATEKSSGTMTGQKTDSACSLDVG